MNKKETSIPPRKRIVYLIVNKGKKVLLPCDVAHQIRELLENNMVKNTTYSYEIGDLDE